MNKNETRLKIIAIIAKILILAFLILLVKVGWNGFVLYLAGMLDTKTLAVFLLLLSGLIILLWVSNKLDKELLVPCGCILLLPIGLLIWLLIFAPKNWSQTYSSTIATQAARPYIQDVVSVSINVSEEKFTSGSNGEIVFTFTNNGNSRLDTEDITIGLPNNFLQCFVIDYPEVPYCTLSKGVGGYFQSITCEGISLFPYDIFVLSIPIAANETGNCEGDITLSTSVRTDSPYYQGSLTISKHFQMRVISESPVVTSTP